MHYANFIFDKDRALKTLGITWHVRDDQIRYYARNIKIERLTKRNILSELSKIFDPLGLLSPVVLYAKKLIQDLWRCQVNWDESVPQDIHVTWLEFAQQFELINQIFFDRKLLLDDYQNVQLHGFCDASNIGYGACIYVRSSDGRGNTTVKLLCAKSRVAPLKTITIPRLELCGALLLARLHHKVKDALNIITDKTTFWCDSTVVLHWLNTSPHLLNIFVASRVAEIQTLTEGLEWRHVRSEDNPADAISRGQLPHAFLQNRIWSSGPTWLNEDDIKWPNEFTRITEVPELKKNVCLVTTVHDLELFERYSSYSKLLRVLAYCLRFRPSNAYFVRYA